MSGEYKDSAFYETLKVGVGNIMNCMSNFETPEGFNILHFPNAYKAVSDINIYFSVQCSLQLPNFTLQLIYRVGNRWTKYVLVFVLYLYVHINN